VATRADQIERVVTGLCRALGGEHPATRVVCPIGVRLLREVAASRLEGRPASGARVLDSARLTIRSLADVPFKKGKEPAPPDDTQERPGPGRLPIPAVPHRPTRTLAERFKAMTGKSLQGRGGRTTRSIATTVADLIQQRSVTGSVARHAVKGKAFRSFVRERTGGGGGDFFTPGESGF